MIAGTPPPAPAPPAGGLTTAPAPPADEQMGDVCPLCGAPLREDQDWCVQCGAAARTRLASAPGWRAPMIALALVILLCVAGLTAALVKLAGGSGTTTVTAGRPAAVVVVGPTGASGASGASGATGATGSPATGSPATGSPATGATVAPPATPAAPATGPSGLLPAAPSGTTATGATAPRRP